MPLLGKKQFSLAKSLTNVGPDEEIYTIQHTQERFRSKDEYEKRVELYKQGIWTCRCTGHTTLTHEEAVKSEQAALKMLRAQFPEMFEKTVLQIIHHSTESLDALNDQAWMKLHQVLVEGESVSFKVNNGAKTLKGSVIGISPNEDASTTSSKCNSPSSDKENSSDGKKSPKKWTPPKLLPYKYSVKLDEGPIINSVPVEDLVRTERPPSKDIVRLFIRSNAVRCGTNNTSPWVVDEPLVKKYALPSKFADFLLSPAKMAEAAKRAEELGKKRKRQSQDGGATKKRKLGDTADKKDKNKNKLMPVSLNKKVKQSKDSDKTDKKKDSDKSENNKKEKKEKKENSLKKKSSPDKKKSSPEKKKSSPDKTKMKQSVIEISDSSDEEVSLATIKKMKTVKADDDSDLDVPLASLTDQGTPKKKSSSTSGSTPNKLKKSDTPKKDKKTPGTPKVKKTDSQKSPGKRKRTDSTDSDVPLSKLAPSTPQKSPSKSLKEKNETTPAKSGTKGSQKSEEKRGRGRPKKGEEKNKVQTISRKFLTKTLKGRYANIQDALNSVEKGESVRKAAMDNNIPYETLRRVSKGGWKQMTLLEITSKNKDGKSSGSASTPKKSPVKKSPAKPQTPLIVKKLLSLNKDEDRHKFNMLMKKAVLVLTPSQKKNLPSPLKEKVQRRVELMEERKALEKMSECEREAYLKEKKEKQKTRMKEKLKQKMKEMRQRYEDQDLKLQPLPAPKLVPTPDNLPNELFGDVAMVTEFISSYSGLLMPESEYPIYTDALMKALAGGSQGFAYLSRVLGVLLQTLLQDEIAEGYSELRVPLSDIAVNPYTASELVRLCLRKDDVGGGDADNDEEELEVPDSLIQQLETQEFFQLECEEKLSILRGLCLRVMGTYSIQDYMEEKQREAVQLTKQRVTEMKGFNEKLKEKKQQKTEDKSSANTSAAEDAPTNGSTLTINSFYGKKLEDSSTNDSPADSQGEDGGDNLLSIVKRRRLMVAKAAQEKEKRDLERRLRQEKEFQEERERRQREMFETKYKDSISLARTVLRHTPIGYDRHHNRYWMFTQTTPGLFIEKGWVGQEINYNPGDIPDERVSEENDTAGSSTPSSSPSKEPGSPIKRLHPTKKKALVESTVPSCGQNLWFTYNSLKDFDALVHNLHPQGIREAALKTEIRKRYPDISRAIQNYQRNNLELRDSDGNEEIVASFKKELSDIETRLRNGGLGGVQNFDKWEAKLMNAPDIAIMGECLLETQDGIMDKFLQKFMKLPRKEEEDEVKKEEEDDEEAEDGDNKEDKTETPEDKKLSAAEKKLQQWKDSVTSCSTLSRLHVLLSMMDSCIKWEKSAENAKCKICRKKGDDDRLLLCDECNQAFHMYCLRPQLIYVPRGDWFCAACVPHTKRRSLAPCRLGDESDSEEDEPQHTNCEECGGEAGEEEGEELVACHKCPSVYHLECHQPPLRRVPRGVWECNDCKNGIRRRKKGRLQRKAASRKSYKSQVQDEEEESEEEEEEEEEESEEEESEEEAPKPPPKTTRGSKSSSTNRRSGRNAESSAPSGSSLRSSRRSNDHHEEGPIPRSRRNPSDLSLCEDILQKLMKHSSSWPFLEPVNKKQVPDYHQIIKKPMDFQTMLKKCARLSYSSPQEFVDDAILVFSNAAKYNELDSEVYSCMKEVEKFFSELLAKHLPDYASTQHFVADSDVSARTRRTRRN